MRVIYINFFGGIMLRKLNRIIQDYMREKRLKIGKYIWDRKKK